MIKDFKKVIIMSITLLVLVICFIVMATVDIDLGILSSLSINGISEKKVGVDGLILEETQHKANYDAELEKLQTAKNDYETAKKKFESIDEATIDMVKDATKDEKYFIEYLWIVLGNYAEDNNLLIDIITPGSKQQATGTEQQMPNTSVVKNSIQIVVNGRYANVADFVYEVENDKELKFKLDNIKMIYAKDNTIQATFNVLNLQVKK